MSIPYMHILHTETVLADNQTPFGILQLQTCSMERPTQSACTGRPVNVTKLSLKRRKIICSLNLPVVLWPVQVQAQSSSAEVQATPSAWRATAALWPVPH